MNEAQKHSKVEVEILAHEKEMMHAAKIKRLNEESSLLEKINHVRSESDKKQWTAKEMLEELKSHGLYDGKITEEEIGFTMATSTKQ